jgi:hypothetical protein
MDRIFLILSVVLKNDHAFPVQVKHSLNGGRYFLKPIQCRLSIRGDILINA